MDEFYEKIKALAETYGGNPYEFVNIIENSFKATPDKKGDLFFDVGVALYNLSYFGLAIAVCNKALEYFIDSKDKAGESICYINLGAAYRNLVNFNKAVEYYEKALEIGREISNKAVESKCYTNLGIVYDNLGDFRKAIEYQERALEIDIEIVNRQGESNCYANLGIVYDNLGDFRKAIEYQERALEVTREIGDKAEESKCYGNLGATYYSLGDFNKAIEYHKRSLEIAIEISDRSGESKCYGNLGNAYYSLGDFNKAVEYYEKALEIAREIGYKAVESKCYISLGVSYDSLGDFRKAIEYQERALEITREIGDRQVESKCYVNLGIAYRDLGDFNKAVEYYEKALEIARKTGNLESERIGTYNLAKVYNDDLNKPELAYDYCRKSIELSEKITRRLIEEEQKIGFASRISGAYQYIVPLCLKLKKKNEAFEFAERGKSRAFLDLLAAAKIKPYVKITPKLKSLLNKEEDYLVKLREVQTRHLRQKKVTVEPGEIDKILVKLDFIYSEIEEFDPEYVFARRGKPMSFTEIYDALTSQKKDTVLIEYFKTKDKVFIFIISSRDKKLHIEQVPVSQERLSLYIENYRRSVVEYPDYGDIGNSWLGLSDYLIDPISIYLAEGDLIYFVPYGSLHYLPLHALELNSEPIIKNNTVAYIPSASLIRFCQNKGSGKLITCASFGVDFESEAKKIAKLFEMKPYIDGTAAKEKVIEACTDKDIIHFSCHGIFDYLDPLSSGVKLYNSEILTAREIFNLKLNTELVTLSACQTGINDRSPGDELVGLTRAFLYAGAPSVIVSLWSVDARSTQELMLEFYNLLNNGKDKATALQKAQVKIMKEYTHPYYWAPFVLVGDWE